MFARMAAKSGVWAHLPARAYWDLTAVLSARIVVQSAPMGHQGGALGHGYGDLHCCEHPFGLHRHAVPCAAFSHHTGVCANKAGSTQTRALDLA